MQEPEIQGPASGPHGEDVRRLADCDQHALRGLLARYGLTLELMDSGSGIPGSYWGEDEAGITDSRLWARPQTPVHSVLHEACHFVCMDDARRAALHTDAGGDYDEENAVCLLQILLAEHLPDTGSGRMCSDMDRWGYSFRLGSARRWFEKDSDDAFEWLRQHNIVARDGTPTWRLRER